MNPRIRELAEQAGFVDKGSNHTAYISFDHKKFALLIIRECADLVDNNDDSRPHLSFGDMFKKHFGVES
jgi:hypothetical protein